MECKCVHPPSEFSASYELIDTLWNVNADPTVGVGREMGINRYIMECKFASVAELARIGT